MRCHVSHVMCNFFGGVGDELAELVGGGSVINEAYILSSLIWSNGAHLPRHYVCLML